MLHAPVNDSKQQASSTKGEPSAREHDWRPGIDGPYVIGPPQIRGGGLRPPAPVSPRKQKLIRLQRAYGNQAVLRMLERSRPAIQPKLVVNEPGDAYEQEADRVADQVMRMPDPGLSIAPAPAQVSRKCAACEEEEAQKVQTKPAGSPEAAAGEAPPIVHEVLRSPGQPLDAATRAFFEPRFGYDFSRVRVHTDGSAAQSARMVNALAYTVGRDVVFRKDYYTPSTRAGAQLLAHELAHVAQQSDAPTFLQCAPSPAASNPEKPTAGGPTQHECMFRNTPEERWADDNPGKVFGVGDVQTEPRPSNELILWNFCVGETKLRSQHIARLREASKRWYKLMITGEAAGKPARRDLRIKILGTASKSGNPDVNETLATGRAESAKEYLTAQGIPEALIEVHGVGSRLPLADETSAENAARNRRVEVFLYVPTREVGGLGPTVDADVRDLAIGKPSWPAPTPFFDSKRNLFGRQAIGMEASARMTLTSLVAAASAGFIQFLVSDDRWAEYTSAKDGSQLILDYDHCLSPFVPCRDVLEATMRFSVDPFSLFLSNLGSMEGKVRLNDTPGAVFPLLYPDPKAGEFSLTRYHWGMSFLVILGVRDDGLFMPLDHAWWSLAGNEGVDAPHRTTTGPPPLVAYGSWQSGGPSGFPLESAMSGKTCRLAARSAEIVPEERPCRPSERR